MYCRNCGNELSSNSNYCPSCGAKQNNITSGIQTSILKFIRGNKLLYAYVIWLLVHITLLISSSKGNSEGFYPWDKPLNDILTFLWKGKPTYFKYDFSWFDKYNVYDFSEFFFYTILFPIAICGLVWCYIYSKKWLKNAIKKYPQPHDMKAKKSSNKMGKPISNLKNINENAIHPNTPKEIHITETPIVLAEQELNKKVLGNTNSIKTEKSENEELQSMPLLARFFGSLIDKIILIFIFVIGFIIISPFGASGKLGTYAGLLNSSPNNYEYIDNIRIDNYRNPNYGVSDAYYRAQERLANGAPYIGSTRELDINITISFVILNLIYYVFFECLLNASFGKRLCGGILLNENKKKVGIGNVLTRASWSAFFMLVAVFLFHFYIGLSYCIVFVLFFLLLDIPIFFTKQSLLDLCTGTIYAKKSSLKK